MTSETKNANKNKNLWDRFRNLWEAKNTSKANPACTHIGATLKDSILKITKLPGPADIISDTFKSWAHTA